MLRPRTDADRARPVRAGRDGAPLVDDMRTKTLLLLAVGVGLVILVAGSLQFLRLADETERAATRPALAVGDTARAADLVATVVSASESAGAMRVVVRIGGVDDPRGLDGFALFVPDRRVAAGGGPVVADGLPARCGAVTVAEQVCTLEFDTSTSTATARVLRLTRGEDRVDWRLAG